MFEPKFMYFTGFYNNPDSEREYALSLEYEPGRNGFPGMFSTTKLPQEVSENIKEFFEKSIVHRKITKWDHNFNTKFSYMTKDWNPHIHHDTETMWGAVLYLTPGAPHESGTGFYKHKATGYEANLRDRPETALNKLGEGKFEHLWERTAYSPNAYNSLVVFRGNNFHKGMHGFGDSIEDSRLTQLFFFDTEY